MLHRLEHLSLGSQWVGAVQGGYGALLEDVRHWGGAGFQSL